MKKITCASGHYINLYGNGDVFIILNEANDEPTAEEYCSIEQEISSVMQTNEFLSQQDLKDRVDEKLTYLEEQMECLQFGYQLIVNKDKSTERAHELMHTAETERRKVLFTAGMSNDKMIIITDAPKEDIEKYCLYHNLMMEDGGHFELFAPLKAKYYVKELFDSEVDDLEDIDIIGYDEVYDLFEHYKP
ncbi:MAG: hypothetical protein UHN47_05765 [Lachnospiraceae bacterium]|nr:hypothetical protein [Lachnospiraceae bacterium]